MSQAIASHETRGPMLQYVHRTTPGAGGRGKGEGGRATVNRTTLRPEGTECFTDSPSVLPLSSFRPVRLLLIGDDLSAFVQQLRGPHPSLARRVQVASTGQQGLQQIHGGHPDVIVVDMDLPDQPGLEVLQQIRSRHARIPVICVAPATRPDVVIAAMKQGAYDCLFKPLQLSELQCVVNQALNVARCAPSAEAEETVPEAETESDILGFCPAMTEVYKAIGRVAAQNVPVLITGESGTGKELAARAIYQHGPRAQAPFLTLNCAAIPEQLLESELFGHEKGAFTGADRRRIGKFEQCHGGTLFLDEIGDMPLALQAKILRLLQEQTFERVGGSETISTDVRLIAATHHDLKARSAKGKFRPDLYYRLAVFSIHLPPLRERGEDLPLLVQHYVRRFSRELGRDVQQVAPEALARLRAYSWPGNVRELQSVLKQALLQASGSVLLPAFLSDNLMRGSVGNGEWSERTAPLTPQHSPPTSLEAFLRRPLTEDIRDLYADAHRQADRLLLPRVLEHTRGNLRQAALLLGIARQTLRLKLRELGLCVTRAVEMESELAGEA